MLRVKASSTLYVDIHCLDDLFRLNAPVSLTCRPLPFCERRRSVVRGNNRASINLSVVKKVVGLGRPL